jgi:hypothetical protein
MSYGGNNGGFDDRPNEAPYSAGNRPYPQSYSDPGFGPPAKPSGNRTLYWILGIVTVVTFGGALVCCGGGYFVVRFATNQLATEFRKPVQNSPEVAEHIGEIEDMSLSFQAMQAAGDQGKLVFEVKGSKGSGQVVVDLQKADRDPENAFVLVLSDGTRLPMTEVELGKGNPDGLPTPEGQIGTDQSPESMADLPDETTQQPDAPATNASDAVVPEQETAESL